MVAIGVLLIITLTLSIVSAENKSQERCRSGYGCRSPFRIIIDGGSTGSRLHIFEFVTNSTGYDEDVSCVRRGSSRADMPMSAFARDTSQQRRRSIVPATVSAHLVPLFDYAASVIPEVYHGTTEVRYEATAGMRLVEESEQSAVYDALHEGLVSSVLPTLGVVFPFRAFRREDIKTLSGELEGFYGAVAANYLSGTIDTKLRIRTAEDSLSYEEPLGAMDMGGSSTQLVFMPSKDYSDNNHNGVTPTTFLNRDDFFSHSYLSYGVDQMREHLWNFWIQEHTDSENKTIDNPCAFQGLTISWNGFTLIGTGDVTTCTSQIKKLIPSLDDPSFSEEQLGRVVGGTTHPPVRGKFLAMSLYFFVLDFLRVMTSSSVSSINETWPSPTLEELSMAIPHLCELQWNGDLEFYQHSTHKYTRPDILPHRCFEAVYLVTLLRDGYGFDPRTRDISYIFDVQSSEVEWTLGHALSLYSEAVVVKNGVMGDFKTDVISVGENDLTEIYNIQTNSSSLSMDCMLR